MAKKKISGLPAGSALNGTELVPIVQTGTTKRITTQDIANLGNSSGVEGSGTINYLSKFTAASTIGNSIASDNGTRLTIDGELRVANADADINLQGTSKSYLLQVVDSDNRFRIYDNTANVERFSITSAGNVGIGTTSPAGQFEVFTNTYKRLWVTYPTIYETKLNIGVDSSLAFDAGEANLNINAGDATYGNLRFNSGSSERMRIAAGSGNLLIGITTDAGYKLDVNGDARILTSLRINGAAGDAYSTKITTEFDGPGQIIQSFFDSNAGTAWQGRLFFRTSANGGALTTQLTIANDGTSTFAGRVNIGNPVATAVAVASTHKVTISIGGVTYYLLATNI